MAVPVIIHRGNSSLALIVFQTLRADAGWVLHCPAFGEEMNRSRRLVSQQARTLAASGLNVVVPDLYGTGDSDGELVEACWSHWIEDLLVIMHWMRGAGALSVTLWGLRTGSLLACQLAGKPNLPIPCDRILLWQPVFKGKQFVDQLLRLSSITKAGGGDSIELLRARSMRGEVIEVGGYRLAPNMLRQLEALDGMCMNIQPGIGVSVVEMAAIEGRGVSRQTSLQLAHWNDQGIVSQASSVMGASFWATPEITCPQLLIECTLDLLVDGVKQEVSPDTEFNRYIDSPSLLMHDKASARTEQIAIFHSGNSELVGVIHDGLSGSECGLLMVVGGPQYRVGSHRSFVQIARAIAQTGIPVMRFDYHGMGDASGEMEGFSHVDQDIENAIDEFQRVFPNVKKIILWGLCDAATAISLYAPNDGRVHGLVLLNPWVSSPAGNAQALLSNYYYRRFRSKAFWRKLFAGGVPVRNSFSALVENIGKAIIPDSYKGKSKVNVHNSPDLLAQLQAALTVYRGKILIVLSGEDVTAAEFRHSVRGNHKIRKRLSGSDVAWRNIVEADHTFSKRLWKDEVVKVTLEWLASIKRGEY